MDCTGGDDKSPEEAFLRKKEALLQLLKAKELKGAPPGQGENAMGGRGMAGQGAKKGRAGGPEAREQGQSMKTIVFCNKVRATGRRALTVT